MPKTSSSPSNAIPVTVKNDDFPRAQMLAAPDEILTDNGVRSQGSTDTLAIWNAKLPGRQAHRQPGVADMPIFDGRWRGKRLASRPSRFARGRGTGMVSGAFPLWRLTESRSGRKAALKRLNSRPGAIASCHRTPRNVWTTGGYTGHSCPPLRIRNSSVWFMRSCDALASSPARLKHQTGTKATLFLCELQAQAAARRARFTSKKSSISRKLTVGS